MEVHTCTYFYLLSLSFLVGAFNTSTFKVIMNMYDPIIFFLVVWDLFSVGRDFPSLVYCHEKFI